MAGAVILRLAAIFGRFERFTFDIGASPLLTLNKLLLFDTATSILDKFPVTHPYFLRDSAKQLGVLDRRKTGDITSMRTVGCIAKRLR